MLLFWWKKYENSFLATAVSYAGTLLLTFGALLLIIFLCQQMRGFIANVMFADIIGVVIGIVIFLVSKMLLNKLTNKIANKS